MWTLVSDIIDPNSGEVVLCAGVTLANDKATELYQRIDGIARDLGYSGASDLLSRIAWYSG